MRIVPDSTVTLYGGVEIDNGEQLAFSSRNGQTAYFNSKLVRQAVPCTMVRKTGALRLEAPGSVVATCNYLSFVNPSFDNKIVYARIVDYDYINNECVEITYAIDYWQTWMFDVTFEDMYIEREHLSEAQATLAASNPYDPSLVELRTGENLPISRDVEKPYYDLTQGDNGDGVLICEELASATSASPDTIGALVLLADINFSDLDSQTPTGQTRPSERFVTVLESVITDDWGYYELTGDTYDYLNATYPGRLTNPGIGSGWSSFSGGTLYPNCSKMSMPCTKIYCENMNTPSVGYSNVEKLLAVLTDADKIDQIISMYAIPNTMFIMSAHTSVGMFTATLSTIKNKLNVRNPKLCLYPFSYLRLEAPNGDTKELRYEDYINVQEGDSQTGDSCEVVLVLDFNGAPNLIVAPNNYKKVGLSPSLTNVNANVLESLIVSQFVTVPYTIDGWTAHMAAISNSIIGNNTVDYGYDIEQKALNNINGVVNQAKLGGEIATDVAQKDPRIVSHGANFITKGAQLDLDVARLKNEMAMSDEAYLTMSGKKDNAVYNNFQYTRPAHAGSIYYQSNGDGSVNYNSVYFMDVAFLRVSLNPAILQRYDQYFDMFGYSSGRCGIPHVVSYVLGSNSANELPDWHSINGKDTTYVKTTNCKIIGGMQPVCSAIEALFNSGVRMIKGD